MQTPDSNYKRCNQNITCLTESFNLTEAVVKIYFETLNFEKIVGLVIPTIFALVILIGLVGNVLVIFVVIRNHQMQNSTNTLILNLAVSDLLFLVFCVPFTAANYALPVWQFSRHWCKGMMYLQSVTAYGSVWTLVLMAFDRYLAVVFPVQSMTLRSVSNTVFLVCLNWFIIIMVNVPHLFEVDVYSYPYVFEMRSICGYLKAVLLQGTELEVRAFYWSFNTFGYMIPLSITLVFYAFMLRKLWFQMPLATFGTRPSHESSRAKRRVTWMVSIVTLVFAVCWLPLNICFFVTGFKYRKGKTPELTKEFFIFQVTSQVLAYSNSCLNPILYAFLSENFRKGFYRLITSSPCRKDGHSSRLSSLRFERTEIRSFVGGHKENNYSTYQTYCVVDDSKHVSEEMDKRNIPLINYQDSLDIQNGRDKRRVSWAEYDDNESAISVQEMAKLRHIYD